MISTETGCPMSRIFCETWGFLLPICSNPSRTLINSSAVRMPAFLRERACAALGARSYRNNPQSKSHDRCQLSKCGSSACRKRPDHIFITQPPHEFVHARAKAGPEYG